MAEEDQYQNQTLLAAAHPSEENDKTQRSLSLKLKIPTKATALYMEAAEEEEEERGVFRRCSECGKQFTSGKALGGHKRACLQKIKNRNNSGNVVAVKLEGDNDQENNNNICYVCHQSFRSVKSLYGHMRKHPEREWRGVQPPKRLLMMNHNDGESFKGWSAKRKRGQRLVMDEDEEEEEEEEEAMQHAVNHLLLLAQPCANDCAKKVIDDEHQEKKLNIDDVSGFDDSNSEETWIVKKNKQKRSRLNDAETMVTYSCTICNKAFGKHQALGGHIASHNKNKNVKESAELQAASDEETGESSRVAAAGSIREHKCNNNFPTGQALGGHKRCHWIGLAEAFSSSSQITTSAGEVITPSITRVVHDFDLNDTPPEYYHFQLF